MGQKVAEKPKIVTLCGSSRFIDIMDVLPFSLPAMYLQRLQTFGQGRRLLGGHIHARGVQLVLREVVGAPEVGVREVGETEVGGREVGAREVGAPEPGVREVGVCEVGAREVGHPEVSAREVGPREVGAGEIGLAKHGMSQIFPD